MEPSHAHLLAVTHIISHRPLRSLRIRLTKIGAKVVRHARYGFFHIAEVSIALNLFEGIVVRIRRLLHQAVVFVTAHAGDRNRWPDLKQEGNGP